MCRATQVSAASQTVPWFHPSLLQVIHSDELFTNAKDNHRDANRPIPTGAKCSQPPSVQEAGGAWDQCTEEHFTHKTQTLQEQAHGQLLHLMKKIFHFSC